MTLLKKNRKGEFLAHLKKTSRSKEKYKKKQENPSRQSGDIVETNERTEGRTDGKTIVTRTGVIRVLFPRSSGDQK